MERSKVAEATLIEMLLNETTHALKKDASFLGKQIEIRRRDGEPNWDANCGIGGTRVVKAFGVALTKVQAQYDLE
jgi:hypothetical protein